MTGNATPEATFWSTVIPAIGTAFQRLTNWNLLRPDTSSQLVTSGRGTHTTGQQDYYSYQDTDNYVTASRTPNGSLAVIFLSQRPHHHGGYEQAVGGLCGAMDGPAHRDAVRGDADLHERVDLHVQLGRRPGRQGRQQLGG